MVALDSSRTRCLPLLVKALTPSHLTSSLLPIPLLTRAYDTHLHIVPALSVLTALLFKAHALMASPAQLVLTHWWRTHFISHSIVPDHPKFIITPLNALNLHSRHLLFATVDIHSS